VTTWPPPSWPLTPAVDHHQHLCSPGVAALMGWGEPVAAAALIAHLDRARVERAAVLSTAYLCADPTRTVPDEDAQLKAANEWTGAEVARFPDRRRGCGGLNPLRAYALAELARCAAAPHLRSGLKLHCQNSRVDYHDPRHLARLQRVFGAANGHGMAIVVHMRASTAAHLKLRYGRDAARIFLDELLPAAPDVPVQLAHLCGGGGYGDPLIHQAVSVFLEAIARGDPRVRRVLFDVTATVNFRTPLEDLVLVARHVRGLGVERVLYGSDRSDAEGTGPTPRKGWAAFRMVPLSEAEVRTIAGNVAPYMT
jgi:predicted TIM-barrel fold metal-dependent hydrolase